MIKCAIIILSLLFSVIETCEAIKYQISILTIEIIMESRKYNPNKETIKSLSKELAILENGYNEHCQ